MNLALNTKHSIRDTQGNVTSVAWWVLCYPWHTTVSCSNHTAAWGNSERNITWVMCIFTQWLHMSFERWVNFQNECLLIFNIYLKFFIPRRGTNHGLHAFQRASLPSALSMFNIHRSKNELFVCKYITYFQSMIYSRTKLLTRVKFSRHVWTGFCGPTGDGKWSHLKIISLNIIIRNSENVQVFEDSLSSFLSWVSKTQPNHWTKRMANTRLAT